MVLFPNQNNAAGVGVVVIYSSGAFMTGLHKSFPNVSKAAVVKDIAAKSCSFCNAIFDCNLKQQLRPLLVHCGSLEGKIIEDVQLLPRSGKCGLKSPPAVFEPFLCFFFTLKNANNKFKVLSYPIR